MNTCEKISECIISLGTIATTMAAMFYWGYIANDIGKLILYFLGMVVIIVSLSYFAYVLNYPTISGEDNPHDI